MIARVCFLNYNYGKLLTLCQILLVFPIFTSSAFFTLSDLPLLVADAQPSATSDSQNLSNNPGNSTDAQIAVYQNNVYVIWSDATTGNGDIYFKRSMDNGTSFGSTENLSNNPGNSTDAQIAVYQNNVYVIWSDATTGNGDIYFKRSMDNGTTFESAENISINNTGSSVFPEISTIGNNIYIAWVDA